MVKGEYSNRINLPVGYVWCRYIRAEPLDILLEFILYFPISFCPPQYQKVCTVHYNYVTVKLFF